MHREPNHTKTAHGLNSESKLLRHQAAAFSPVHGIAGVRTPGSVEATNEDASRPQGTKSPGFGFFSKVTIEIHEHVEASNDVGLRRVSPDAHLYETEICALIGTKWMMHEFRTIQLHRRVFTRAVSY